MKKYIKQFFTLKPIRDNSISKKYALTGIILIFLSQALDALTTIKGLTIGATEQNSIMAQLINDKGFNYFISVKLLGAFFLSWFSYKRKYAPFIISSIYFLVVVNNLIIISNLLDK